MSNKTSLEIFAIELYEKGLLTGNGDEIQEILETCKKIHILEIKGFAHFMMMGGEYTRNHINKEFDLYWNKNFGDNEQQ